MAAQVVQQTQDQEEARLPDRPNPGLSGFGKLQLLGAYTTMMIALCSGLKPSTAQAEDRAVPAAVRRADTHENPLGIALGTEKSGKLTLEVFIPKGEHYSHQIVPTHLNLFNNRDFARAYEDGATKRGGGLLFGSIDAPIQLEPGKEAIVLSRKVLGTHNKNNLGTDFSSFLLIRQGDETYCAHIEMRMGSTDLLQQIVKTEHFPNQLVARGYPTVRLARAFMGAETSYADAFTGLDPSKLSQEARAQLEKMRPQYYRSHLASSMEVYRDMPRGRVVFDIIGLDEEPIAGEKNEHGAWVPDTGRLERRTYHLRDTVTVDAAGALVLTLTHVTENKPEKWQESAFGFTHGMRIDPDRVKAGEVPLDVEVTKNPPNVLPKQEESPLLFNAATPSEIPAAPGVVIPNPGAGDEPWDGSAFAEVEIDPVARRLERMEYPAEALMHDRPEGKGALGFGWQLDARSNLVLVSPQGIVDAERVQKAFEQTITDAFNEGEALAKELAYRRILKLALEEAEKKGEAFDLESFDPETDKTWKARYRRQLKAASFEDGTQRVVDGQYVPEGIVTKAVRLALLEILIRESAARTAVSGSVPPLQFDPEAKNVQALDRHVRRLLGSRESKALRVEMFGTIRQELDKED